MNSGLKLSDPSEGAGGGAGGPPVAELAVLAGPHEVLVATVVGMLVEGPVAVHDVAGVDVTAAEVVLHGLAVVAELHHLALEVGPLVDADAVGALAGLQAENAQNKELGGEASAHICSPNILKIRKLNSHMHF